MSSSFPTVIIGATGAIGSAIARRLVAQKQSVHLISRNKDLLQKLSAELGDARFSVADVMKETELEQAVKEAAQHSKGFSGLAYCVGSIPLMSFTSATSQHFLTAFQLNTLGAITALRAAHAPLLHAANASTPDASQSTPTQPAHSLPARPSSVLLFSTVAAQLGFANHSVIAAAKAALDGLTRSLAAEWAPHIRVNAIAPTLTRSKIAEPLHRSEALLSAVAATHPMRRTGEADDIAGVAALLLGDEGRYVTGQVWSVDGGKSTLLMDGARAKVQAGKK